MLVIVSLSRLDNDRIEIALARPQHDSNPSQNYAFEKEVRAVLSETNCCPKDFNCKYEGRQRLLRKRHPPTAYLSSGLPWPNTARSNG